MKKIGFLLTLLSWGCASLVQAQSETPETRLDLAEIEWKLDSMTPKFNFPPIADSLFDRASLNKYNFPADSVPRYSAEVYEQRLKDMGTMIPMAYNSDVQAYIDLYAFRRREQVSRMLGLQYVYFPMFEEELARQGLPIELKYLPIVESALNPHAKSRAGAVGLWQFMLPTGKLYGLNVTSYVDERRDPQKATRAAVKYLKDMYASFGDWLLVIAAYNCGPGNVRRAILRNNGEKDFWKIKHSLPAETRGYVPAFIAANYIFNYSAEHNVYPTYVDFSFAQDTVRITRMNIGLDYLAAVTKTNYYTLRDLNPELHGNAVPYMAEGYPLRVPAEAADVFALYRDSLYNFIAEAQKDTVVPQINYNEVSPHARMTYAELNSNAPKTTTAGAVQPSGTNLVQYRVRSGDVVGSIAKRYGVSAESIKSWNNLRGYMIHPGQVLKIYTHQRAADAASSTA
jgi:membrane-bound lytic murein transglycosylase D